MITKLFTPMKVGNCTIPNRLVVPAMVTNYCDEDGFLTDRYMAYIEEKAKGGWGMIITEDYSVTPHGKGYQYIPGFYKDEHVALNKELTRRVHEHGSKIFCQMYHPGRQSSHAVNGNVQPLAPSGTKDPICMDLAREMTVEEIHTLVEDFGQAARRCKESGFDGIELHCAHGYLLAEFLSSYVNKRVDQYGGCFDNRVRIVDEIIAAMRKEVGDFAPKIIQMQIDPQKIGDVVGQRGKTINAIIDETGVKIDIDDEGNVSICGTEKENMEKAAKYIQTIVTDYEAGQLFEGKVISIKEFGAFVEFAPGKEGMVHISKLSKQRVDKVEDVVSIGDVVKVVCLGKDKMGRFSFSMKDVAE